MTDLTRAAPRTYHGPLGPIVNWPLPANTQLFEGAALMRQAAGGYVINCVPTASGIFLGFGMTDQDNRTGAPGGGANASVEMPVVMRGLAWLTVAHTSTWGLANANDTVYASDSNSFTLSAGTNNIVIGKVVIVPAAAVGAASAVVLVAFEATQLRSI